MALFGWAIGDYLLVSVDVDRAPMQATTALCFLCFVAHILARTASITTFALNSGACCFRFDISDLLLVEDQQTANSSLCQCPNFGG